MNGRRFSRKGEAGTVSMFERGCLGFMAVATLLVLAGGGLPLLVVYLVKAPGPGQPLSIFGVSYFNVLFLFFISAAILVYGATFFIRMGPAGIFLFFLLSLFCSIPFVVGLRRDLTLEQVIAGGGIFSGWPFFVSPVFIFTGALMPAGVVIALSLQLKNILGRERTMPFWSFLAVCFGIAAFLGLSALSQLGRPSILSLPDVMKRALSAHQNTALTFYPIERVEKGGDRPGDIQQAINGGDSGDMARSGGSSIEKELRSVLVRLDYLISHLEARQGRSGTGPHTGIAGMGSALPETGRPLAGTGGEDIPAFGKRSRLTQSNGASLGKGDGAVAGPAGIEQVIRRISGLLSELELYLALEGEAGKSHGGYLRGEEKNRLEAIGRELQEIREVLHGQESL